jgi:hypothetical protein
MVLFLIKFFLGFKSGEQTITARWQRYKNFFFYFGKEAQGNQTSVCHLIFRPVE